MQKLRNLKHIFVVIILALSLVFSSVFLPKEYSNIFNGTFIYRTGQDTWQDTLYKHSIRPSKKDIVIIRIDNESLNALQAKGNLKMLTIPKSHYMNLIDKLQLAGVKGIAIDIIFENKDDKEKDFVNTLKKYNNIVIASEYTSNMCAKKLESFIKIGGYTRMGDTHKSTPFDTMSGALIKDYKTSEYSCAVSFIKILKKNFSLLDKSAKEKYSWVKDINTDTPGFWKQEYARKLLCEKSFDSEYENCPGVPRSIYRDVPWGIVSMNDGFGYERITHADIGSAPYASWFTGTGKNVKRDDLILDTLPLALYAKTMKPMSSAAYISLLREYTLNPYFGGDRTYPSISFIDALEMGKSSTISNFRGKYVFIGESGTAIHDSIVSPVTGKRMDGVETHAHYFDGLMQGKMLDKIQDLHYFGLLIGLTLFMVVLYFFLPIVLSFLLAIGISIAILYCARYAYDIERILIDVVPVFLAGSIATFPLTYIYKFFVVDREKRQLKMNFAHYIDPRVVDEIASKSESIELGGEKRMLSVLFSDIAGFTTISEKLDPRDLFYLMTAYLSNMTDILIREGGTLDKYIGDAVMGFFGAPKSYDDHAIRAANTALLMQKALPAFNADITKRGIDPIDFRVGIATGDVMVGNIGSHDRFNYTVLGDTVNLASRLEGTGKEYNVHIIISDTTKVGLSPLFFTRELDTIAVKGKSEGVKIHELVGYSLDYVDRTRYTLYERALGYYRAGDYREAGKLWQSQAEIDPPSRVMMLRCAELLKGNIKVQNGTFIMNHK